MRVLPQSKVQALLTVAERMTDYISDQEFLRKAWVLPQVLAPPINSAPPLDIDEETAVELRLALGKRSETLSHEEIKRKLGLA